MVVTKDKLIKELEGVSSNARVMALVRINGETYIKPILKVTINKNNVIVLENNKELNND